MSEFVWRSGGGRADPGLLGGKAVNLDRLTRLGHQVPPFFVVTTAAFRAAGASGASTLPAGLREQIAAAHVEIIPAGEYVAVRSSAVGEDAAGESFAGIHDSFLYVRGPDAVLDAIRRVWASVASERAVAYRTSKGIASDGVTIAVVVQRMVDAVVSGVAFTADPTTGDVHKTVVSALYGLGEGLVSGGLDADLFSIDKSSPAREASRQIAEKTERFVFDSAKRAGVAREAVPAESVTRASLTDAQVQQVADVAHQIERAYGTPQDIEFALDRAGTLWILQSRPITTVEELGPAAGHGLLWDNSNIIESFSGVTSPMTFSVIRRAYATVYRCFSEVMGIAPGIIRRSEPLYQNMLGLIRGRVYYNLRSWYLLLRLFPGFEYNRQFMESMMGVKESYEPERVAPPSLARRYLVELPALLRLLARSTLNFARIRARVTAFETLFEAHYRRWAAMDVSEMRPHELLATYAEMERDILEQWRAPIINDLFVMVNYGVLKRLCATWCGDTTGSLQNDLICGEGGIRSTEPTFRLMELAREVREQPALREVFAKATPADIGRALRRDPRFRDFRAAFDRYLDEYGFRCMNELKLEEPTLRDSPDFAYEVIRNYVMAHSAVDPAAIMGREAEIRSRAEARTNQLLHSWWKRRVFRRILENARLGVKNRENMRFARTRIFGLVRELVRSLGAQLAQAGILDRADDVFYLTLDEAFDFVKGTAVTTRLRDLVALRRVEFDAYRRDDSSTPDDRFETFGMVYSHNRFRGRAAVVAHADGPLRGIACSPGKVVNTVKVILTPSDDARLNGEILVAGRTDPGWVPLYPSVSGLLIERGSILSHSAIVAREMGIPTIVGIPGLTTTLKSGQRVSMDGSTGVVEIVDT
ncbi:MAG TPA: PEP/pyruvate-binding domain-containing protein [Gemmatimonadaceae bacterium]|nr:PEP/pyruvate-binding domain-containing protein [Gemmatimonadaceae bacterium]